jgi:hypothetical protein
MYRLSDTVTQNSETFIKWTSLFGLRRRRMCRAGAKERERKRVGRRGRHYYLSGSDVRTCDEFETRM